MDKLDLCEIEFLVEETVLYEIDDDFLDMSCNRNYDASDKSITFIDLGETMGFYGATHEHIENIIRHLSHKLRIDLNDVDHNITMSELIQICNKKHNKIN